METFVSLSLELLKFLKRATVNLSKITIIGVSRSKIVHILGISSIK